jgi:hypothetical protein
MKILSNKSVNIEFYIIKLSNWWAKHIKLLINIFQIIDWLLDHEISII